METHHILLVDDEATDALLTRRALSRLGLRLTIALAENGEEALAYLRQEGHFAGAPRPDLILLDMHMPGKSGLEVLADVRADPKIQDIPVVILTSSAGAADMADANQSQADGYVVKPSGLASFNQVVQDIGRLWTERILQARATPHT